MDPENVEAPRKRIKTDNDTTTDEAIVAAPDLAAKSPEDAQSAKEIEVGITEFASPGTAGFAGIFKKR